MLLIVTLVLAIGLVAYVLWHSGTAPSRTARLGFQDADHPRTLPEGGAPDRRFDLPSAWDAARIPTAARFGQPLGPLSQVSGKFGLPAAEGGPPLPGELREGIGGGVTSLGDPVYAIADGLVLHAASPSEEWGKVIVLGHRTADGRHIQSLYAHLHRMQAKPGDLVPLGTPIGTVGSADGHYPARLHFQILRGTGPAIPATPSTHTPLQVDPSAFLAEMSASSAGDSMASPLSRVLSGDAEPWTSLEIRGAEHLSDLPAGDQ